MHILVLSIVQHSALTAGAFIVLNAGTVALVCSLYMTYLFFLYKKRIRTGLYESFPPEG